MYLRPSLLCSLLRMGHCTRIAGVGCDSGWPPQRLSASSPRFNEGEPALFCSLMFTYDAPLSCGCRLNRLWLEDSVGIVMTTGQLEAVRRPLALNLLITGFKQVWPSNRKKMEDANFQTCIFIIITILIIIINIFIIDNIITESTLTHDPQCYLAVCVYVCIVECCGPLYQHSWNASYPNK